MAHQIEQMAYVGQTPWHGLGNQLTPNQPIEVWAKQAGMDWQIESSNVSYMAENHKGFLPKGLQSAAHRLCTPMAHKVHTCSLKSIFSHAHVVRENDCTFLPPAGGHLCEAFLTR